MLEIRRDIAAVAALAIATYTDLGLIVGTLLISIAFALSGRAPILAPRRDRSVDD